MKKEKAIKESTLPDNIILWILTLLVFLVPTLISPYNFANFEPIKLLALKSGAILVVAVWIVKIVQEKKIRVVYTFLRFPVMFFLILTVLATVFSTQLHTSIYGELYRNEGLLTILIYLLLYYTTINFIQKRRQLNILLTSLITSSTVVAIYGVFQHFGWDFISWDPARMPIDRSFSSFGNPVFLGGFLCLVIPVSFTMLFQKRNTTAQVVLSISTFLLVSCLIFTTTRAAFVGLLLSIGLIVTLVYHSLWRRKLILAVVVGIFIAANLATLVPGQPTTARRPGTPLTQRIAKVSELEKGTVASRIFVWKTSLPATVDRPLLGFGPDTFKYIYPRYKPKNWMRTLAEKIPFDKAHNEFLQIAISQGLLGLLVFGWLLIAFFWKTISKIYQLEKETAGERALLLTGFVAGIFGYLVQIQFSFSVFSYSFAFWIMLGLGVLLSYPKRQQLPQVEIDLEEQVGYKIWQWILILSSPPAILLLTYWLIAGRDVDISRDKAYQVGIYLWVVTAVITSVYFASRPLYADMHVQRGWANLNADIAHQAAEEFSQVTRLNPSEARHWVLLGYAYSQQLKTSYGQTSHQIYNQAIDAFNRGEQTNPLEEDIFFHRANLNLEAGEILSNPQLFDLAIADLNQLLKRDPYNPEVHFNLGLAYANKKQYDKAILEWKKSIAINPDLSEAYFNIGRAYQLKGNLKKAKEYYQKALDVDPDHTNAKKALKELNKQD